MKKKVKPKLSQIRKHLQPNLGASLNVYVHAEDGYVEDHRYEPAHADAAGERAHVLDGELAHVGAADGQTSSL